MTKIYILNSFILLQFLLTSCQDKKDLFNTMKPLDSVAYISYRWRTNKSQTGLELFISHYLSINKDGKYLAMRHNTTPDPAQYFSGVLTDSGIDLIRSILKYKWDSAYFNPQPRIYDGNAYYLVYKINNQVAHISYIPKDSPKPLFDLSMNFDSVIFKSNNQVSPFSLKEAQEAIERKDSGHLPKIESPHITIK
jgi:hypothetical protein